MNAFPHVVRCAYVQVVLEAGVSEAGPLPLAGWALGGEVALRRHCQQRMPRHQLPAQYRVTEALVRGPRPLATHPGAMAACRVTAQQSPVNSRRAIWLVSL